MSDEDGNDGDDGLTECQVCSAPIVTVVIRGPSPAERYARPCGHRLPADFDIEDSLGSWQEITHRARGRRWRLSRNGTGRAIGRAGYLVACRRVTRWKYICIDIQKITYG